MMKSLPEKISYEIVLPEYEKLLMLKKALMINDNEEINANILLKIAREHNLVEIYLIGFLVDVVVNAPIEIQKQNDLLSTNYNIPKEYTKIFNQTKKLFSTNPKFRKYAAKICADLDLFAPRNCAVINITLYGLCPKLISNVVVLEPRNVVMNFHILQKWLSEQRKIDYNNLNPLEQKIILYLANGYTPDEILNEKVMEGNTCDDDRLRTIIYDILPARCNVESVCQVMAIMFMSNPDLCDIKKAMCMLENIIKNEDF